MFTLYRIAIVVACAAILLFIAALPRVPLPMTSRDIAPNHYFASWGVLGHRYHYEVKTRQFEAVEYVSEGRLWDGFCFGDIRGKVIRVQRRVGFGAITGVVEQSVQVPALGFLPVCSWRGFEQIGSWEDWWHVTEGWWHLEGVPNHAVRLIEEGRLIRWKMRPLYPSPQPRSKAADIT